MLFVSASRCDPSGLPPEKFGIILTHPKDIAKGLQGGG
jgi:hypothetical protein